MAGALNYQEFTSDLRCPSIVCSSIEENEETLAVFDVDQHVRQIGKGQFRAHVAVRTVGEAEFFADRYNTALSLHCTAPKGAVGFMFPRSASGRFLASGEQLGEDRLIFLTGYSGTDIVIPALAGTEDIGMSPEAFENRMAVLCPTIDIPEQATIYEGDPEKLHALRQAVVDIVTEPTRRFPDEVVANLIDRTIAWLGESAPYRGPETLTIDPSRPKIAKKAQEFIEEHYDDTFRMEDLCRETGVGVRTVQRCFKDYFDVTVTEYLKTKRLDAAHRDLDAGHPKTDTVTDIALQHGFGHLGRFSVEFKERFGESPGVTLATKGSQKSAVREIPASAFLASADLLSSAKDDQS